MTRNLKTAAKWLEGILLICCIATLLYAYGERNIRFVRPVANMFHNFWNILLPALAF